MRAAIQSIFNYHPTWTVILTPLLLMVLPLMVPGQEALCAYVLILMAVYWITECIPLAVTSMLPLVLFPTLGIMKASAVSVLYFKDTNWLLIGGLTIAVAVELTNLHKRIALRVLLAVGAKPKSLMAGFMGTTFFLSMWISNTATTAMMLPIVEAIFQELSITKEKAKKEKAEDEKPDAIAYINDAFEKDEINADNEKFEPSDVIENNNNINMPSGVEVALPNTNLQSYTKDEKKFKRIWKGVTIAVPYAASIGGTATLTGTSPNLILSGQFELLFPDADQNLSFGAWFGYCFPQAVVLVLFVYIWMSFYFIGFTLQDFTCCSKAAKGDDEIRTERVIKTEYAKLGEMTWAEKTVLFVFALTALLWFFREPGFMPGWGTLFNEKYVSGGTVAIAMATLLFFLPSERPMFLQSPRKHIMRPVPAVLQWPIVQRKIAWDVTLLLGGGFALAEASVSTGLSAWIGGQLTFLSGLEEWIICLIVTALVCLFTECTSNTATASLFVPILAQLAQAIEVHPIYLMVPPIVASSLAFMLPVATPPNAVAFSYGHLKVMDLIKAGWLANLLGIGTLTLFINTYGMVYFNLGEFPDWAALPNETATTIAP